ncbi:peptidase S41 [Idiomarina sp. WRN-38]|jgi:C-terminal processing protease CtpA/Prc|uniref:S41 family peptidase n=1 Tax=Idiomarina sp. OXR-189 TaxID=3100175 RepID=UPI0007338B33|nr:S41 family peptidase [Idiomarina sp. OXR-189]KTG23990.1 peptidase S41 [Idiomarina sp. H105]OAE91381.1 peptidase S41 [Idiomarina sp. WRN-38]WPZ02288.1 S41 family peptidase [Idiomarina sp. OXR-189]
MTFKKSLLLIGIAATLSACGGSDDSNYATCSVEDQNQRFFNYMKEDYFWADQLQDSIDPEAFDSIDALLEELRVPEDRYSYILTEEEYEQLYVNATYFGFGFSMEQISDTRVKIRFVYNGSPADTAGIERADELIAIDDVPVAELIAAGEFDDALGPNEEGLSRKLTWKKTDGTEQTDVLSKVEVETNTVMGAQTTALDNGDTAGYFTLDSFINRTGSDLNEAFDLFANEGVDHLIIDVRYNGGGLIRYANQTSSQAAGNNVLGETFLTYRFNEQNSDKNETLPFRLVDGTQQLDLDTVYVLTTGSSCSSSEIIINSLKPYVNVVTIGENTCGKPVGQQPNFEVLCNKVTFAINFETVNAEGEGQYYDGLAPTCEVEDQIIADWGSEQDPLTGAAYNYIETGSCPATASASAETKKSAQQRSFVDPVFNLKDKRRTLY